MRQDRRPYWVKKVYLSFRAWYCNHFLRPACDYLGGYDTIMRPWYVSISGPNIRIGECATIIGESNYRVNIAVWGRELGAGEINIGDYVLISPGARISAADKIVIGDNVMIAHGVYITDSDWHTVYDRVARPDEVTPVIIKDNVWLGDRSTILKGVTIGENSVVAANSVVVKDVPANVVVAGNPAKVVKQLDAEREMKKRSDFYADPDAQVRYFDDIDKMVLSGNGFFNWLRTLVAPTRKD
ncbi:MAG: acetyltransferase-like isoleucine patch superfamily enzyme [Oceanicoccus sp.]|jgi:acetyltransferase-like isoleucine patch superfamily enzyme